CFFLSAPLSIVIVKKSPDIVMNRVRRIDALLSRCGPRIETVHRSYILDSEAPVYDGRSCDNTGECCKELRKFPCPAFSMQDEKWRVKHSTDTESTLLRRFQERIRGGNV